MNSYIEKDTRDEHNGHVCLNACTGVPVAHSASSEKSTTTSTTTHTLLADALIPGLSILPDHPTCISV
jgi:hypothetical protein